MNPLPTPDELIANFLGWAGAPALVVSLITLAFAAQSWAELGRKGLELARTTRDLANRPNPPGTLDFAELILSQTLVIAGTYSTTQLMQIMFQNDSSGRNFADGKLFDMNEVFRAVTSYSYWNSTSAFAVACAVALAVFADICCLNNWRAGWAVIHALGFPLVFGALCLSILAGVGGCSTLSLAMQNSGGYTSDMVWLYLTWITLLLGMPVGLMWASRATRKFFRSTL